MTDPAHTLAAALPKHTIDEGPIAVDSRDIRRVLFELNDQRINLRKITEDGGE